MSAASSSLSTKDHLTWSLYYWHTWCSTLRLLVPFQGHHLATLCSVSEQTNIPWDHKIEQRTLACCPPQWTVPCQFPHPSTIMTTNDVGRDMRMQTRSYWGDGELVMGLRSNVLCTRNLWLDHLQFQRKTTACLVSQAPILHCFSLNFNTLLYGPTW